MSNSIEIKPTTADDILQFSGKRQDETVRAMTVWLNGEIACIAGVTIERGRTVAFSDMADVDVPKLTVWRVAKELKAFICGMRIPAIAIADPTKPCSRRFLQALGLRFVGEIEGHAYYQL